MVYRVPFDSTLPTVRSHSIDGLLGERLHRDCGHPPLPRRRSGRSRWGGEGVPASQSIFVFWSVNNCSGLLFSALFPNRLHQRGQTALFYASSRDQVGPVLQLLSHGAHINYRDKVRSYICSSSWTLLARQPPHNFISMNRSLVLYSFALVGIYPFPLYGLHGTDFTAIYCWCCRKVIRRCIMRRNSAP